jgi:hypothetical protein
MARRRNEDGGPLGLILVALAVLGAVLLTAAIYIPPIALLLVLLYVEFRAPRTPQNFTLTDEEKHELSEFDRYRHAIAVNRHRIKEEGSDLKQNRDGSFHRGSKLGMQLNSELEDLDSVENELDGREYSIRKHSHTTFNMWARVTSLQFALRRTTGAYVLVVLALYLLDPPFIDSFSQFVGQHVLMRISGVQDALYGGVLISTLGCAVLLCVLYKIRRGLIERSAEAMGVCKGYFPDDNETGSGGATVTETFSPSHAQDMAEMWGRRFEAIADAASRYENGTCHKKKGGYDADESAGECEEENKQAKEEWYETLGVSPTASAREINAAWRLKMTKNHPDRVAELDAEFRVLAEERSKRLNAAREDGLRHAQV